MPSENPIIKNWGSITEDVKKDVVRWLDYESRCSLKLCSKSDYQIVNSIKFEIGKLNIHETLSQFIDEKTTIRLELDSFTIWLTEKDNLTKIDRGWNGEIIEEFKSANFYKCSDVRDEDLIGVSASDFRLYDGKISREFVKQMLEIHLKFGKQNDEFEVTLNLEGEDSDFDPFLCIPKNLKIQRIKKDGYTENAFLGNIFGGFENVHGIQDRRKLSIIPYNTQFSINCQIYKKAMGPFEMCPF
ncbi:unnamed protein product [Caenorhabditis nigoni]